MPHGAHRANLSVCMHLKWLMDEMANKLKMDPIQFRISEPF